MLNSKSINAGADAEKTAKYYEGYQQGTETPGTGSNDSRVHDEPVGKWEGSLAENLNLSGANIGKGELSSAMVGKDPVTDEKLVHNAGPRHKPGWDLAFSAPKSVSIFWAASDDRVREALSRVHHDAVQKAIAHMEQKNIFKERIGHAGVGQRPATKLLVATFEHSSNRAGEAHLHTHAVVLNIGEHGKCIDYKISHEKKVGAFYRRELEAGLNRLGLQTEKDREWAFRLKDVPRDFDRHFSSRREELKRLFRERGCESDYAARDQLAINSRSAKTDNPRKLAIEGARTFAKDHDWHPTAIFDRAQKNMASSRIPTFRPVERHVQAPGTSQKDVGHKAEKTGNAGTGKPRQAETKRLAREKSRKTVSEHKRREQQPTKDRGDSGQQSNYEGNPRKIEPRPLGKNTTLVDARKAREVTQPRPDAKLPKAPDLSRHSYTPREQKPVPALNIEPGTKQTFEGRLIDHGTAPFRFQEGASKSYYATIQLPNSEKQTLWGRELEAAIKRSGAISQEEKKAQRGPGDPMPKGDGIRLERELNPTTWLKMERGPTGDPVYRNGRPVTRPEKGVTTTWKAERGERYRHDPKEEKLDLKTRIRDAGYGAQKQFRWEMGREGQRVKWAVKTELGRLTSEISNAARWEHARATYKPQAPDNFRGKVQHHIRAYQAMGRTPTLLRLIRNPVRTIARETTRASTRATVTAFRVAWKVGFKPALRSATRITKGMTKGAIRIAVKSVSSMAKGAVRGLARTHSKWQGKVIDQGVSPYQHKPGNSQTPWVKIYHGQGKSTTYWGKDLPRALKEAGVKNGDFIRLQKLQQPGTRETQWKAFTGSAARGKGGQLGTTKAGLKALQAATRTLGHETLKAAKAAPKLAMGKGVELSKEAQNTLKAAKESAQKVIQTTKAPRQNAIRQERQIEKTQTQQARKEAGREKPKEISQTPQSKEKAGGQQAEREKAREPKQQEQEKETTRQREDKSSDRDTQNDRENHSGNIMKGENDRTDSHEQSGDQKDATTGREPASERQDTGPEQERKPSISQEQERPEKEREAGSERDSGNEMKGQPERDRGSEKEPEAQQQEAGRERDKGDETQREKQPEREQEKDSGNEMKGERSGERDASQADKSERTAGDERQPAPGRETESSAGNERSTGPQDKDSGKDDQQERQPSDTKEADRTDSQGKESGERERTDNSHTDDAEKKQEATAGHETEGKEAGSQSETDRSQGSSDLENERDTGDKASDQDKDEDKDRGSATADGRFQSLDEQIERIGTESRGEFNSREDLDAKIEQIGKEHEKDDRRDEKSSGKDEKEVEKDDGRGR
jgi:conjugative relaxase-like TrwC/TraI family protein